MKTCEHCGKEHNRKRFCSNRCKDRWHNTHNEVRHRRAVFFNRGIILMKNESLQERLGIEQEDDHDIAQGDMELGWDGHKNAY